MSVQTVAVSTRRRINRRLMPFLFLLFIVAFLDRVSVGFAGLQMNHALGSLDAVFASAGAFSSQAISCWKFQVP